MLRSAMNGMEDGPKDPAGRGRAAAAKQAYVAAVASRSTVAGRLSATTLLGEARPCDDPEYRVAN